MLRRFKDSIFRGPRQGVSRSTIVRQGILQIAIGCFISALSLLSSSGNTRPFYLPFELLLGMSFVLQGLAELLPAERRRLAGGLRLGSVVAGALGLLTAIVGFAS